MKSSLIIVAFFVLGTLTGLSNFLPSFLIVNNINLYVLYGLMFFVGVSLGNDVGFLKRFKQIRPRYLLLPLFTIVGTLGGCAAASLLLIKVSLLDSMAIGSGMGYYSLSSIFIGEYRGAELGTLALLTNIFREIIALLFAPLLVKYFGKLAPISVAGATSMDTTLPVISRVVEPQYAIVSVYHGFVTDFSVPFLVTFFCMI